MGSGSMKSHEPFKVAPTAAPGTSPIVTAASQSSTPAGIGTSDLVDTLAMTIGSANPSVLDDIPSTALTEPGVSISSSVDLIEEQWAERQALTPIPDQLPVGDGMGAALAVGGADFIDGSATLICFAGPTSNDEPRQVLTATLTPGAEEKLLDALTSPDAPMIPTLVERDLTGRIPLDQDHHIHERLAKIAKSINSKYKNNNPASPHTEANLATLTTELEEMQAEALPGSVESEMLQRYRDDITECQKRLETDFCLPYNEGGRIAMIEPFGKHGKALVTEMVPDPTVTSEGLAVTRRKASRIEVTKDPSGKARWDGSSRTPADGTELAVDLGDGYTAVVRPGGMNPAGKAEHGLHNTLEVIAPPGTDTHHQLVAQLGKLNLVNRPMSQAEAEWSYLQRNVWAENLQDHPSVTQAMKKAAGIEEAHEHLLLTQRAHLAVGMNDAQLEGFARQLKIDAEADALTDKLRIFRGGVATAMGHADSNTLTSLPGYRPVPQRVKGWLTWPRLNYDHTKATQAFTGRHLTHNLTSGNIAQVLMSGALVSTERRSMMGIKGVGMSESADKMTGGSRGVFLRVTSAGHGAHLIWDDPAKVLSRTDWYGYNGDHYGATVEGSGNSHGQTRDPYTAAKFNASNNEIIIANGLDLLGADAPSRVKCGSQKKRDQVTTALTKAGVTTIGGRPLHEVITT